MNDRNRYGAALAAGGGLLLALVLASLCIGRYPVPLGQTVRILAKGIGFRPEVTWTGAMEAAVLRIRLPRVLQACLVGCALSVAGACYQGVFRNPMAAPDLLGASSGAAFGASLAILTGCASAVVTCGAFLGGVVAVLLVMLFASRARGKKVLNLILAGITVSSLFSAGTSLIKLIADPNDQLPKITYWLMGSLGSTKAGDVLFSAVPIALGVLPLLLLRWRINLLTMEDEEAASMGVAPGRLRVLAILCSTLITAAAVSVSGVIGWVGLIVPHICRRLTGNDYRKLLPFSMIGGAFFMLLTDDVSRNLAATEIPVGILTAMIGAPFFLWLLAGRGKTE